MKTTILGLAFLLGLFGGVADAAVVLTFQVNTSSISGTNGYVDFQFNPGGAGAQAATAFISSFTTNGTLGAADPSSGDVTPINPVLPATFTLGNSTGFNDVFQRILFGGLITFNITLDGPAITAPNASAFGTTFSFSLYDNDAVTPLLSSGLTGAVGTIDVGPKGAVTPTEIANGAGRSVATISFAGVPEPSTMLLIPVGLLLVAASQLRRKRVRP